MRTSRKVYMRLGLALALLASCRDASPPTENTHPAEQSFSITKWTDHTELFVEFSPLVVGKETPLAVHLTDLDTFQPVSADMLTTDLESRDDQRLIVRTEAPVVPGIYRPVLKPDKPGTYRLIFRRSHAETREVHDTVIAGEVQIAATAEQVQSKTGELAHKGITFLKEQQWRIEFATEPVIAKELAATLKLNQKVEPGEPLARILPLHPAATNRAELESAVKTAQSELQAAQQELARVQDLYKDRIVPKRRLEQAQKEVAVLQAHLTAARSQLSLLDTNQTLDSQTLTATLEKFFLRSPIAGTVVTTHMTPGALVEAGQALFTIMDLERVWIEGRLFEQDLSQVQHVEQAQFTSPALAEPLALTAPAARLVTIGSVLDPANRSVPLILAVENPGERLKIGMHGQLTVPTGKTVRDIAIPLSAVVDDKGIPIAFVQAEGETFERRELTLGIQSDGYVQVKAGLTVGERVVTKGAYRVHLVSLSSEIPAHGHAH